jgi:hypothetical protein
MEEGTFGKGYLAGIGKLLHMPLQALYTRLIKRMSIQFEEFDLMSKAISWTARE